jgi:NAD(P)-dependent dehydrogenase (short-subunit alcohol dehydrogenase family)
MARVLVTGSADGLGRNAAVALLDAGHAVVVHARSRDRLAAARDLVDRGAVPVTGDLSSQQETLGVAGQVNALGVMDAVIHNAGVYTGAGILPVNVLAVYLLTCLITRPGRLVYLSSGMHRVPTRMGGPGASDDLRLGHVTQVWLAVGGGPEGPYLGPLLVPPAAAGT